MYFLYMPVPETKNKKNSLGGKYSKFIVIFISKYKSCIALKDRPDIQLKKQTMQKEQILYKFLSAF